MVINIKRNGEIEDSFSTLEQRTKVHRQERVVWNSLGDGPWIVRFGEEDGSPFLEHRRGLTDIDVPKDGKSAGGQSTRFTVATDVPIDSRFGYRVLRPGQDIFPDVPPPELIVEPGGGLVRGAATTKKKKTAPARRKTAVRKAAKKTAGRKSTARKTATKKAAPRRRTTRKAAKKAAKKR